MRGQVGLETLSTPRDLWRNLKTDLTITSRIWRVRAEDVPPPEEREEWLYAQWQEIDDWIAATIGAEHVPAASPRAAPTESPAG